MRLLVPALLLAATPVVAQGLDRHPWSGAVEAAGRHFAVETNTFPELAASLRDRLERSYALFEDRFGPLEDRARRAMRVALFRTQGEYLELGDGVAGAVGHFDAALDRCALAWRGDTDIVGWPIAVHEACHHYLRRRHPDACLPSWYAEGIACYFEGLQDPTSGEFGVSRLRLRHAKAALALDQANLALVLRSTAHVRNGRLEMENFSSSRFYALAWSVVHFLATDARYRDGFRRFELRLFATRGAPAFAAARAQRILLEECGDLGELDREWHAHLARTVMPPEADRPPVYRWELTSANPFVRFSGLRNLEGVTMTPGLRAAVLRCASDRDLVVRTEACRRLALAMDADAVPSLVTALRVGDAELRRIAIPALARADARDAVPLLVKEREHRDLALRTLAAIRDPIAFPSLRAAVVDVSLPASVRARCAAALAVDEEAVPELTVAAGDDAVAVRAAARASLLRLGRSFDVDTGTARVHRANEQARLALGLPASEAAPGEALFAVGPEEEQEAIDRLRSLLRDPLAPDRDKVRACVRLAAAGSRRSVPLLQRLCLPRHSDSVRLEAVRALVRITGETRGYEPGQPASDREAVFRAWARDVG